MKVRVSIPGASMVMDLPDEKAMNIFRKTTEILCSAGAQAVRDMAAEPVTVEVGAADFPETVPETAAAGEDISTREMETEPEPAEDTVDETHDILPSGGVNQKIKYKGFMHMKCPKCGEVRSFCMKKPADHYHCAACGCRTEFTEPLVPLWVNCECGAQYKYWTNMDEPVFDINCFECGNPVAVQWNDKKKLYAPIK